MKKSSQYKSNREDALEKINTYRKKIDHIDAEILDLLGKRISLILMIGSIKKSLKMPIRSVLREQKLLETLKSMAKQKKIPPELIKNIYNQILSSSRSLQKQTKSRV